MSLYVNGVGRVATDLQEGNNVVRFRIAFPRHDKKDNTDFFTVVCFDAWTREFCQKFIKKGSQVMVSGILREHTEIVLEHVEFVGSRNNMEPSDNDGFTPIEDNLEGDDLPFS